MILIFFILSVLAIIWSMVEIVSPHVVLHIYQKTGLQFFSERKAIHLIRIDGFISWLVFTLLAAYLYGKL